MCWETFQKNQLLQHRNMVDHWWPWIDMLPLAFETPSNGIEKLPTLKHPAVTQNPSTPWVLSNENKIKRKTSRPKRRKKKQKTHPNKKNISTARPVVMKIQLLVPWTKWWKVITSSKGRGSTNLTTSKYRKNMSKQVIEMIEDERDEYERNTGGWQAKHVCIYN